MTNVRDKDQIICQWCGQPSQMVWVHGHGQCSNCSVNVDECCKGEKCESVIENPTDVKVNEKTAQVNYE